METPKIEGLPGAVPGKELFQRFTRAGGAEAGAARGQCKELRPPLLSCQRSESRVSPSKSPPPQRGETRTRAAAEPAAGSALARLPRAGFRGHGPHGGGARGVSFLSRPVPSRPGEGAAAASGHTCGAAAAAEEAPGGPTAQTGRRPAGP